MYKSSVGERTMRWGGKQDHQQTDQELISTQYPSYTRDHNLHSLNKGFDTAVCASSDYTAASVCLIALTIRVRK